METTWDDFSMDKRMKRILQLKRRMLKREGGRFFSDEEKRDEDDEENKIVAFRRSWESCYAEGYGSFDGTTIVPPMLYAFGSTPKYASTDCTLQIFSIKVAEVKEGLHWPLHVYGLIATRDSIDPRRNILFHRTRDNCQTITEGVPYLLLTGSSRAVVLIDPVTFEVQLKARGRTESEDKVLCFDILTTQHPSGYLGCPPHISTRSLRCKQSKLEFAFAVLSRSVEATIRVEIVDGSWPEHLRGLLTTGTGTIVYARIPLVDSQDGRMPINGSGVIQLSRQVVCVELSGELKVDAVAFEFDDDNFDLVVAKGSVVFTPKKASVSWESLLLGPSLHLWSMNRGVALFDALAPARHQLQMGLGQLDLYLFYFKCCTVVALEVPVTGSPNSPWQAHSFQLQLVTGRSVRR